MVVVLVIVVGEAVSIATSNIEVPIVVPSIEVSIVVSNVAVAVVISTSCSQLNDDSVVFSQDLYRGRGPFRCCREAARQSGDGKGFWSLPACDING